MGEHNTIISAHECRYSRFKNTYPAYAAIQKYGLSKKCFLYILLGILMAHFAIFFTAAFLFFGALQAHDINVSFYERCCGGESEELLYLVGDESVPIVPWEDWRIEKVGSYCFALGLIGTPIGSFMAGGTCSENIQSQVCKAGIGVAIVFGILLIVGSTIGLIYGGQRSYADLFNEGLRIRDARRCIQ